MQSNPIGFQCHCQPASRAHHGFGELITADADEKSFSCRPRALDALLAKLRKHLLVDTVHRAAQSKLALRESGLPAVSNVSEKGGSAVASAALNALLYS